MISAPCARVAATLDRGASVGITRIDRVPTSSAAIATACAWLPDENATTPRGRSVFGIERTKFAAPRILNAPPRWKFSHLKNARVPLASSKLRDVMHWVRFAIPRIRSAASRMRSGVTASVPCSFIDNIFQRFPFHEMVEVPDEHFDRGLHPADGVVGRVGREQDVRQLVERMPGRERLHV